MDVLLDPAVCTVPVTKCNLILEPYTRAAVILDGRAITVTNSNRIAVMI